MLRINTSSVLLSLLYGSFHALRANLYYTGSVSSLLATYVCRLRRFVVNLRLVLLQTRLALVLALYKCSE